MTVLPYEASAEDTAKISNMALRPVPAAVTAELAKFAEHRTAEFNRHRTGGAVVSTTVESEKANAYAVPLVHLRTCKHKRSAARQVALSGLPRSRLRPEHA